MNIKSKITTLAILMAATCAAGEGQRKVTVCLLETGLASEKAQFALARAISSEMFAPIGVKLEWRCPKSGPQETIVISLAIPSENLKPGELAYALPYEGTHIVIFYDRVRRLKPDRVATVLAHVMVHEVTHILQGFSRHSPTGVMKARWDADDFSEMGWKPLPFSEDDVVLIHRGLDTREARFASATLIPRVLPRASCTTETGCWHSMKTGARNRLGRGYSCISFRPAQRTLCVSGEIRSNQTSA